MSATSAAPASHPSTASSSKIVRATVLVSGGGTNLQALIDKSKPNGYLHDLQIVRVITDREKGEEGLARAKKVGIPTARLDSQPYRPKKGDPVIPGEVKFNETWRRRYDDELQKLVLQDKPDLIINAGFMHVYTSAFLSPMTAASIPAINLHPSLPASHPQHIAGANSLEQAYQKFLAGDPDFTKTGMMIHYVIEEIDKGEPIVVVEVPFEEKDKGNWEGFKSKFHKREWEAIVEGTRRVCDVILAKRESA